MDVTALKCRSMAALAVPGKVWGRQAAAALQVARVSDARCNAVSAGARPENGYFSEAALATKSSAKMDWRVRSSGNGSGQLASEDGGSRSTTRLNATVEKANDGGAAEEKNVKVFGTSEASCDEGSSYLAVQNILDSEGGNSKEDYKHRAHIFSESDVFFSALKDRNSHGLN